MADIKSILGEEMYGQIMSKLPEGQTLILNDGSYIPRERLNEKVEEVNLLTKQHEELTKTLKDLQGKTAITDELKTQLSEIQTKFEQEKSEFEDKLRQIQIDKAVEVNLVKHKAKNPKAVKALIDWDKIEYKDGEVVNLSEQIQAIKESDSYLFDADAKQQLPDTGQRHNMGSIKNPYKKETFNLTEQIELEKNNPTLAAQLKKESI